MTYFLNKHGAIGDYVFVPRKNYRDLVIARIVKFTPKQIQVVYMGQGNYFETYLTPEVILINPSDLAARPKAQ